MAPLDIRSIIEDIVLTPYLHTARNREDVRRRAHEEEAKRSSGVCFSGMGPGVFRPLSDEALIVEARGHLAFADGPRGHFVKSLRKLERDYPAEAYQLTGVWCRDLADERQPLNVRAVAVAMLILNKLSGFDAEDARDALCELVLEEAPERKAA